MTDVYTKQGEPDRRYQKRDENLAKLIPLLRKPARVDDLASALGVTRRAVYFFFKDLEERGVMVARTGSRADGRWFIVPRN